MPLSPVNHDCEPTGMRLMTSAGKSKPNVTDKGAALKSARVDRLGRALRENLKRRRKAAAGVDTPADNKGGNKPD